MGDRAMKWLMRLAVGAVVLWAVAASAAEGHDNIDLHAGKFRDHWIAQPGQKGSKADGFATWRNWMPREKLFSPGRAQTPPPRQAETDNSRYEAYEAVIRKAIRLGIDTVMMSMSDFKAAIAAKEKENE